MCVCVYVYICWYSQRHANLLTRVGSTTTFTPVGSSVGISLSFSPFFTSISLHNFLASGRAVLFWVIDIENIERGK